ncbi:hypothetical protein [Glaciecola sp. 1036]|uniref:hypothetical protein n=1 Tax=Alteromonadaceae TaxID=72275 RepID=UPI003D041DAF
MMIITDAEKEFLSGLETANAYCCTTDAHGAPSVIRAELIKKVLLGIPIDGVVYKLSRAGITLEKVTIEGRLDLDNIDCVENGKVPSLEFKDCLFNGGFSANNAQLSRLVLKRSVFAGDFSDTATVSLDNCRIDGTLNLNAIGPVDDQTYCWVNARDALIDGSLLLTDANLHCPKRDLLTSKQTPRYALNLLNAKVSGDIEVKEGLTAIGGIKLRNTLVEGDVWLLGSKLVAGEGYALLAQGAQIKGGLSLKPSVHSLDKSSDEKELINKSELEGGLNFFGASIDRLLEIRGIQVRPSAKQIDDEQGVSISFNQIKLGDGLVVGSFVTQHSMVQMKTPLAITISHASIKGGVYIAGVKVDRADKTYSLVMQNTSITGNFVSEHVLFKGQIISSEFAGYMQVSDCTIGGYCFIQNTKIGDENSVSILDFQRNTVQGIGELRNVDLKKSLDMRNSVFNSGLSIRIKRHTIDTFIETRYCQLDLRSIKVAGNLFISADTQHLGLTKSEIDGYCTLEATISGSFYAQEAIIKGSFELNNVKFRGFEGNEDSEEQNEFLLTRCQIGQALMFNNPMKVNFDDIILKNVRLYPSLCYPNYYYCEADYSGNFTADDHEGSASFLVRKDKPLSKENLILCNSNSNLFHSLNEQNELDISTEEKAKDYIKLFCANIWAQKGAFVVFESANHLPKEYLIKTDAGRDLSEIEPLKSIPLASDEAKEIDKNKVLSPSDRYLFRAYTRYGKDIFLYYFVIQETNYLVCVSETTVFTFDERATPKTIAPFRIKSESFTRPSLYTENEPDNEIITEEEREQLLTLINQKLAQELKASGLGTAYVDLSDTSVNQLIDDDGQAWGKDITLKLTNFTYNRFNDSELTKDKPWSIWHKFTFYLTTKRANFVRNLSEVFNKIGFVHLSNELASNKWAIKPLKPEKTPIKSRIKHRLNWLSLQYTKPAAKKSNRLIRFLKWAPFLNAEDEPRKVNLWQFQSFPYIQAAATFRKEGVHELARQIDYEAHKYSSLKYAKNAGYLSPLVYFLHYLYKISSKFGLSPNRVFCWLLAFILVGGLMVEVANQKGVMVMETVTVNQLNSTSDTSFTSTEDAQFPVLPCNRNIQPILYAADIFLPLIDLGQERRCTLGTPSLMVEKPQFTQHGSLISTVEASLSSHTPSSLSFWQWARSLYSILGWVMLSLFIFALTNRLRSPEIHRR